MTSEPDTVEAVIKALAINGGWGKSPHYSICKQYLAMAEAAIAADREELAKQGFLIIKDDEMGLFRKVYL